MLTNSFQGDIKFILNKITNKENFSFARSGDGELSIIENRFIDIRKKANGEFKYDPHDETDSFYREELIKAHEYKHPNYYIGVSCQCCERYERVINIRKKVGSNLTWANLFVNSNYDFFLNNFLKEFSKRTVNIVCNSKADVDLLPFPVKRVFSVGTNAYKEDYQTIEEIKKYIDQNKLVDNIFVLCAGPFGNILAHQLFEYSSNNTFIDCGSTLDPLMGLGKTRDYHNILSFDRRKVCIW